MIYDYIFQVIFFALEKCYKNYCFNPLSTSKSKPATPATFYQSASRDMFLFTKTASRANLDFRKIIWPKKIRYIEEWYRYLLLSISAKKSGE